MDIQHFISLIRKYKNPTEVSDLMFTELIDKIVVYEAEGVGKAKTQKVDIYFNYVGQVDIAYTEEELAEIKRAGRTGRKRSDWRNSVSVKKPIERSERQKNLLKTVAKSSKQRYVLIVGKSLPLQATDRFSVQRIAAIRQGRIRQKPIEKRKKEVIIIVSVYVLCVAVLTGLHTVSRNSVPRNVKR